jgi:hypothetical protein
VHERELEKRFFMTLKVISHDEAMVLTRSLDDEMKSWFAVLQVPGNATNAACRKEMSTEIARVRTLRANLSLIILAFNCNLSSAVALGTALYAYAANADADTDGSLWRGVASAIGTVVNEASKLSAEVVAQAQEKTKQECTETQSRKDMAAKRVELAEAEKEEKAASAELLRAQALEAKHRSMSFIKRIFVSAK